MTARATTVTEETEVTNHAVRLYALAVSLVVLFLVWAVVAAHPWQSKAHAAPDPRVRALVLRERRLRHDSVLVQRVVKRRWAHYRIALAKRKQEIAAVEKKHHQAVLAAQAAASVPAPTAVSSSSYAPSPSVQVVTLPPVTITRTS
jgi:hypothetical protein